MLETANATLIPRATKNELRTGCRVIVAITRRTARPPIAAEGLSGRIEGDQVRRSADIRSNHPLRTDGLTEVTFGPAVDSSVREAHQLPPDMDLPSVATLVRYSQESSPTCPIVSFSICHPPGGNRHLVGYAVGSDQSFRILICATPVSGFQSMLIFPAGSAPVATKWEKCDRNMADFSSLAFLNSFSPS